MFAPAFGGLSSNAVGVKCRKTNEMVVPDAVPAPVAQEALANHAAARATVTGGMRDALSNVRPLRFEQSTQACMVVCDERLRPIFNAQQAVTPPYSWPSPQVQALCEVFVLRRTRRRGSDQPRSDRGGPSSSREYGPPVTGPSGAAVRDN